MFRLLFDRIFGYLRFKINDRKLLFGRCAVHGELLLRRVHFCRSRRQHGSRILDALGKRNSAHLSKRDYFLSKRDYVETSLLLRANLWGAEPKYRLKSRQKFDSQV